MDQVRLNKLENLLVSCGEAKFERVNIKQMQLILEGVVALSDLIKETKNPPMPEVKPLASPVISKPGKRK